MSTSTKDKNQHDLFINDPLLSIHTFKLEYAATDLQELRLLLNKYGYNKILATGAVALQSPRPAFLMLITEFPSTSTNTSNKITIHATNFVTLTITLTELETLIGLCKLLGESVGAQTFLEEWITKDGNIIRAGAYRI